MHEGNEERRVEDRLDRVEARLIEQEHRLWSALRNFLTRKDWPKGDPRRRATWMALIWVWFGPMTLAVGGGGATLGVLIWQNWLIAEQVKATERASRNAERTRLIGVLWDVKEVGFIKKKTVPVASPRTRKEALFRFVHIERERFKEKGDADSLVDLSGAQLSDIDTTSLDLGSMSKITLRGADLRGANLFDARLEGAFLFGAHLEGAYLFRAHLDGATLRGAHLEGAIVGMEHPNWLDEDVWTTVWIDDTVLGRRWKIRRR